MSDLAALARTSSPCPTCGAAARASCVTRRAGLRYGPSFVHAARERPLRAAWRIGYDAGANAGIDTVVAVVRSTLRGTAGQSYSSGAVFEWVNGPVATRARETFET